MKLGQQLVHYRKHHQLSQEELAEKIYVTRQSISNWENDRTYPDIQSLLLLSQVFQVSLDDLIKGDLEEMKTLVAQTEVHRFNKDTHYMLIGMISMSLTAFPLLYFLDWYWGALLLIAQFLPTLFFANRIERFKKQHHVQTYREIVAISEGQTLDSLDKRVEKAKYPYQKPLIVLAFSLATASITLLISLIVLWLFR